MAPPTASWGGPEAGRIATNREGPTSRAGRLIGVEHLIRSHEDPTDSILRVIGRRAPQEPYRLIAPARGTTPHFLVDLRITGRTFGAGLITLRR
jgi:hypothetical protein